MISRTYVPAAPGTIVMRLSCLTVDDFTSDEEIPKDLSPFFTDEAVVVSWRIINVGTDDDIVVPITLEGNALKFTPEGTLVIKWPDGSCTYKGEIYASLELLLKKARNVQSFIYRQLTGAA